MQQREHKVRCEPIFKPDLDDQRPIQLLLVCSVAISRPKYVAWMRAASSLRIRVAVYPITRYGHLDPCAPLPFGDNPPLGQYVTDGCLVVCLDDDFTSAGHTMCPSGWTTCTLCACALQEQGTDAGFDFPAPSPVTPSFPRSHVRAILGSDTVTSSHVRSPGGGMPCNYLFVRGEHGESHAVAQASNQRLVRWNTALQTRLLHRLATAPPPRTDPSAVETVEEVPPQRIKHGASGFWLAAAGRSLTAKAHDLESHPW